MRRAGRLGEFVSVHTNEKHHTVHLSCDGGRVCRPLIIVKDGRPLVTREHIQQVWWLAKCREKRLDLGFGGRGEGERACSVAGDGCLGFRV